MAPERVTKSQRKEDRALVRSHGRRVEEPSQLGSQSSDDNNVANLATKMQREVLLCSDPNY